MNKIIAGEFPSKTPADMAIARLRAAGVSNDDICLFHVNPPGEHDRTPIGGDRDESPGAKQAEKGGVAGAVVGGVVGAAVGAASAVLVGPMAVPIGLGVGAYTGSLVGGLNATKDTSAFVRSAGELIAVNLSGGNVPEDQVIRILSESGANPIERAEGTWAGGEWADFDPILPPNLVSVSSTGAAPPAR